MSVINDAVEDGVGQRRIADQVVPAVNRKLAGDQRGATNVAFFGDLQQVASLLRSERFEPQWSRISFTPPTVRTSLA